MTIANQDLTWLGGRISDASSEVYRHLVANRKVNPTEAALAVASSMSLAAREMLIMRGKLEGVIPKTMGNDFVLRDLTVHQDISEVILDLEIQSLQRYHSKFVWTGWISKRRRPL